MTHPEIDPWTRFRQGDREAFAEIYFTHYESLLNYGRWFTPDAALVEDAIQDLFVELWQYHATLSATTSVRFYLLRALRNQLGRRLQSPFRPLDAADGLPFEATYAFEPRWVEAQAKQETLAALRRAINQLTPRQREVIYLRFFNDLDYAEVAAVMGLSYQATRNQVYLALKALREHLPARWQPFAGLVMACLAGS